MHGNELAVRGVIPSVLPSGRSRRQPAMRCRRRLQDVSRAKRPLECCEPSACSTRNGRSTSLEALRAELHAAINTAVACDKRQGRLREKAQYMRDAAIKALHVGHEKDARGLLEVKAKLLEGAAASERRAQVNRALADKLREVIEALQ